MVSAGSQTYLHVLVHTGSPDNDQGLYWADLTLSWQPPKSKEKDKEKEKEGKDHKDKDKDQLKEKELLKEKDRDTAFGPEVSGWPLAPG